MLMRRIAAGLAVAGALAAGAAPAAVAAPAESTAQPLSSPGWHKVFVWPSDSDFIWDFCAAQADSYRGEPDVRAVECRWAPPHNVELWIRTDN